jgi:hypothetical protein
MKQQDPSEIVSHFGPGSTNGMTTLTTRPKSATAANAIVNRRALVSRSGGGDSTLVRHEPAVDQHVGASHEAAVVGRQEHGQRGDVLG